MKKLILLLIATILFAGGTSVSLPCSDGQYQRIQTKECLPLQNPSWGFKEFIHGADYPLSECSQSALKTLISSIPASGGTVLIPECIIKLSGAINIPSNVIIQGAGIGKTVIENNTTSSIFVLRGSNNILRHFSLNGKGNSLDGITGYYSKGNVLVEFVEAYNFKIDQGSGISFLTASPLINSQFTVRYCKSYNALIGIDLKVSEVAHSLFYSNEVFGNAEYGFDLSSNDGVELAGNYMHDNGVAGAKSPIATNIIYHHNDIYKNANAGLVYQLSRPSAIVRVENNSIVNNGGAAFSAWSTTMDTLYLTDNNVSGSLFNGYSITAVGIKNVVVTGDHGKIYK
jgi:hypothetical protein